jgi:CDGSH-type Zn-finger protein
VGKIKIAKDGPYLVSGRVPLAKETLIYNRAGIPQKWEGGEKYPNKESYALCRCGRSKDKPFCDGTHATTGFTNKEDGTPK